MCGALDGKKVFLKLWTHSQKSGGFSVSAHPGGITLTSLETAGMTMLADVVLSIHLGTTILQVPL